MGEIDFADRQKTSIKKRVIRIGYLKAMVEVEHGGLQVEHPVTKTQMRI